MTTTAASPSPSDPTGTTAADPRRIFARAADLACQVVAAVRPDQLDGPTPCTEYDVRQLVGHTVAVLRRVAAVGRGKHPSSVSQVASEPDDGWGRAASAAAGEVAAVWSDDGVLTRMLQLPFGTLPGAVALSVYIAEVTTHTWDIAVATGQAPAFDPEVAAAGLAAAQRALPAHGRDEVPFGPVMPVSDDASTLERLVAWQGRDPRWSPAG